MHPCRRHGDAAGIRHPRPGQAVRGAGPQQYRGQAHGHAAAPAGRHRDGLPLQDAGTGGHHPGGGHPGVRCGPGGSCHAGYGEGRGRGHRRGHEPEQRGQALRRCRLRRGRTQGILHHSGARRRGAHDPGHADAQYPHRSPEPPGGEVHRRKERRGFWPRRS